jgi:hypothetical protein
MPLRLGHSRQAFCLSKRTSKPDKSSSWASAICALDAPSAAVGKRRLAVSDGVHPRLRRDFLLIGPHELLKILSGNYRCLDRFTGG